METSVIPLELDATVVFPELGADKLKFRSHVEVEEKVFKTECMYCFKTPLHPGELDYPYKQARCLNNFLFLIISARYSK